MSTEAGLSARESIDSASESPGFMLWHATLRWQRYISAALRPFDLTHVQFVLLASVWWLKTQGMGTHQYQVARHSGIDTKMASQVLRRLEERGLIHRVTDLVDTRAKRISVTDQGAQIIDKARAVVERVDAEYFSVVPDQSALLDVLRALAKEDYLGRSG
ncbi:MAG: MarR family winged helix-turn-helix transcriptional regulator [Pseudonocardiaceae bacterium]